MNDNIRQLTHSDISDTVKLFQTSFQHDHIYDEYGLDVNQKLQAFTDCIVYAIDYGQSFGVYQNNKLISFLLGFDYHKGFQENPAAMATVFGLDEQGVSLYKELSAFFEEAKKHANLYYIMSIATQQAYRQKGFASLLIDHLIRSTSMDIMGDVSSMISMPMYYKRGFSANPLGDNYNMVILTR